MGAEPGRRVSPVEWTVISGALKRNLSPAVGALAAPGAIAALSQNLKSIGCDVGFSIRGVNTT